MAKDIFTESLAKHVRKYVDSNASITHAAGGAVVVENPSPHINYFFLGKTTTNVTGEFYLVTIYVHEPPRDLGLDGKAVIHVRRGILGIGRRIIVEGRGRIGELVEELRGSGILNALYDSSYEEIVVRMGVKTPFLEAGDKSIVMIGRSSIFYGLRPGRMIGKLYVTGRRVFEELLTLVYRLSSP